MAMIIPSEGELELLKKMIVNTADTEQYLLKLYRNNYTPDENATESSFMEANFSGYADVTIARSDWSDPSIVTGVGETTLALQSWTCSGGSNTIYGYYILGEDSGKVLGVERFFSPRIVTNAIVIEFAPKYTLQSTS